MSTGKLQRRLGVLERQRTSQARRFDHRRYAYLDCLSDEELEKLVVLAEKAEQAEAQGVAVVWTEEELTLLMRVGEVRQRWPSGS